MIFGSVNILAAFLAFQILYRLKISFPLPYEWEIEMHSQRTCQSKMIYGRAINILLYMPNDLLDKCQSDLVLIQPKEPSQFGLC